MIWIIIAWHILGIVVGGTVAVSIMRFRNEKKKAGTIRVDTSEGSPYLFLELEKGGMEKIQTNEYVILKLNLKNYISQ